MGIDVFVEDDDVHAAALASTAGYARLVDLFRKSLAPWDREVPALHALFGAGEIEAKHVARLLKDVERARTVLTDHDAIAPAQDALDALSFVARAAKRKKRGVAHDGPTLVPLKAAPRIATPASTFGDDGGFTRAEQARFPFSRDRDGRGAAAARTSAAVVIPAGAWHGVWFRHGVVFSSGRGGHNKLQFDLTVRDGVLEGKGVDTQYKAFRLDGAHDHAGGVSLVQRYARTDHAELRCVRYRARYEPKTKVAAGLLRWGKGGRDDMLGGVFLAPRTVPLKRLIVLLTEYGECESAVGNLLMDRSSAKWVRAQLGAIAQGRPPARSEDPETNQVLRDLSKLVRGSPFGAAVREVLITSLAHGA